MDENQLNSFTDNLLNTFTQKAGSGKISEMIIGFNEVKEILKNEFCKQYKRGYQTAEKEIDKKQTLKQQKEN